MAVLGHQHVANDLEARLATQLVERLSESELEAIRVKDAGAPVDVGR
jgi:hypothetical protein